MPDSRNPRRSPESAFRPMGDEGGLVVMSMRREIQVLNPVGIRIFALLDGTHSEADIVRMVADEFDVTPEVAAGDVADFLKVLRENGMLADEEHESVGKGSR